MSMLYIYIYIYIYMSVIYIYMCMYILYGVYQYIIHYTYVFSSVIFCFSLSITREAAYRFPPADCFGEILIGLAVDAGASGCLYEVVNATTHGHTSVADTYGNVKRT